MRDPRTPTTTDGYERPQHPWQCGLADEGPQCPLGPDGSGHCPAAAACRPVRGGERWQCNRSALRGGPCSTGPGPEGTCAIVYRCAPVRSLRTRRGRFLVGVLAAALGAACMALSGGGRNQLIAPGPLSAHHAQLVERGGATARCAHCHSAAEMTVDQWWERSTTASSATPTQPMRCLTCHERTIDREFVLAAHGVSLDELNAANDIAVAVAWDKRMRDPREPIACSACHREHQGLDHNLTTPSDACQACHQEQYDSFANGHPEFGVWPHERRTRIAFDHASHQAKHFPTEKREFQCAACHQPDATGKRQLTGSYASTCAECHDKSIAASLAEAAPVLKLPTIDIEALAAAGLRVDGWPEGAAGDLEGAQLAPAVALLAADPAVLSATAKLGPTLDLYDVIPDDAAQLKLAADVAGSIRRLVDDLASRGQMAIEERLTSLLGRKLRKEELSALSGGLSPDVVNGYRDRWFGAAPRQEPAATRTEELQKVAAGGWMRDDATLSLRYQPSGHADPWLTAWLDLLAEAASGPHAAVFDPLLRAAMTPTAAGQCGSCHSVERDAAGRLAIQWRPFDSLREPAGFTRFDHGPHVIQPQTGDCQACHRIRSSGDGALAYRGDDPQQFVSGFEPMDKAACAACHTPHGAGDGCTQCHSYHLQSF